MALLHQQYYYNYCYYYDKQAAGKRYYNIQYLHLQRSTVYCVPQKKTGTQNLYR